MSQPLQNSPNGSLYRALARDGAVRIIGVHAREAVDRTREAHHLGQAAVRIASEGVVATALLSAHIKGEERMMVQIQSQVPELAFFAEIDGEGCVRARLTPAQIGSRAGRLQGVLLAIKSNAEREMYRGATAIEDETIEAALRAHLGSSSQVEAMLWIDHKSATGVLVERMPGSSEEMSSDAFAAVYGRLADRAVSEMVRELADGMLGGEPVELLDRRDLIWRCTCSQGRVESVISALDPQTLTEMIEEDGGAEITCHFCNTAYRVEVERLRELLDAVRS